MVVFYGDLSNKYIPIRDALFAIDLTNGTLISHLKETPLLNGGSNYLLSTSQSHEFGVAIHDIDKPHVFLFRNPPSGILITLTAS